MTYNEIIASVAQSTGCSKKFVDRVYKSYWKVVREYMTSQPLKQDLTDEEFLELRPNVNIPSIGKFYITPKRYRRIKNKNEILNNKKYAKDKVN